MKKIILLIWILISVNVQAGDELSRKFLEVKDSKDFVSLPLKFYDQDVEFKYVVTNDKEEFIIVAPSRESTSKKDFFTSLTVTIRWILKNYKFGKVSTTKIVFALDGDSEKYPLFVISKNNLRLLDNRDFGPKDLMAFDDNGGLVYPLKLILRRGDFVQMKGRKEVLEYKKQYSEFLKTFDISPLIEGAIEAWYEKKKMK